MAEQATKQALSIEDLDKILEVLRRHQYAGTNSYRLGLSLGLLPRTLDRIEKDHKGDSDRCLLECMKEWLKQVDDVKSKGGPTYYVLINGLRSIEENAVADGIDKEKHPACMILAKYQSYRSILDTLPHFSLLLFKEGLIEGITLPATSQDLMRGIQRAVCANQHNLEKFGAVLQQFTTTAAAAKAIFIAFREVFIGDSSTVQQPSTEEGSVCIPPALTPEFAKMRKELNHTIYKVNEVVCDASPPVSLDKLKKLIRIGYPEYKPQLDSCNDIDDVFYLISEKSSLTNIILLETVVDQFKLEEAKPLVQEYKERVKDFCSKGPLRDFLDEKFSRSSPLKGEIATLFVNASVEDFVIKDVEDLIGMGLGINSAILVEVKRINSFTITCSFPLVLSKLLITNTFKNIKFLQEKGVYKFTIGYYSCDLTQVGEGIVNEPTMSSVYSDIGGLEQLVVSLNVQLRENSEKGEEVVSLDEVTGINETLQQRSKGPIKDDMHELYDQFTLLTKEVTQELESIVQLDHDMLTRITNCSKQYIGITKSFKGATVSDVFDELRPHYDFLNCEVIEAIVERFLTEHEVYFKLQEYALKREVFLEFVTLLELKSAIQEGLIPREDCLGDTTCRVVIKLTGRWGSILFKIFQEVVKFIIGKHLFTHIDIQIGSVVVSFLAPITQLQSLYDRASLKIEFMNRIGIIEMYIIDSCDNLYQIMSPIDESSIKYDQSLLDAVNEGQDFEISILLKLMASINKESNNVRSTATCPEHIELAHIISEPNEAQISISFHHGASLHEPQLSLSLSDTDHIHGMSLVRPSMSQLMELLHPLTQWKTFGVHLLPQSQEHLVAEIELENQTIEDRKFALFTKWLEVDPEPTWDKVITSLGKVNMNKLASQVIETLQQRSKESTTERATGITSRRSSSSQISLILPPENQTQLSTTSSYKSNLDFAETNLMYTYVMNEDPSSTQGYCIIINNSAGSYYGEEQLKEMRRVFGDQLGFHVQIYTNLTRKGIYHLLTAVAKTDHSDLHCLIVIVLSKGAEEKVVYGFDGKKIHLKDIMIPFSRDLCPSLSGKPKLFFTDTQLEVVGRVKNTACSEEILAIPDTLVVNHFSTEEQTEEKRFLLKLMDIFCNEFVFQDEMTKFTMNCDHDHVTYVDNLTKPLQFTRRPARGSFNEGPHVVQELKLALKVLSTLRDASIKELETNRDYIFRICQNIRRARMAGAVTSLVGGGLTIIGLALAPVTLGGSIGLSVVGAGVGVAGGAVSIASTVTERHESKDKFKKAHAILEIDRQLTVQVNKLLIKLSKIIENILERNPNTSIEEAIRTILYQEKHLTTGAVATKTSVGAVQAAHTAFQGRIFALKVAGPAARSVAVVGGLGLGLVGALTIPLDIYELISNSIRLYKKSETDTIKKFNGYLETLHEEKEEIQQMLLELT